MNTILLVILAAVAGVAITLQGQFMGVMDLRLGTRESIFITYASGGLIASLIMLAGRWENLKAYYQVPWYAFSAGLLGLVIVGTIGYVVPRLGVTKGFMLVVASQFIVAALIDHFGIFGAVIRPFDI